MDMKNDQALIFDEIEISELNGNARDAIEGFATGITIVAAVAGIVALT